MSLNDVELLSSLLTFYSDRAVSFASLFVASIFGLVAYLAVLPGWSGNGLILGLLSLVPYSVFALAGWYTFRKFSFYADIAHIIEHDGLRIPNQERLKAIKVSPSRSYFKTERGRARQGKEIRLPEYLQDRIGERQESPWKKFLDNFTLLYGLLIVMMGIIAFVPKIFPRLF